MKIHQNDDFYFSAYAVWKLTESSSLMLSFTQIGGLQAWDTTGIKSRLINILRCIADSMDYGCVYIEHWLRW